MNVLFATDGSACSRHAIREGLRLLAGRPITATVVAVADVTPVTYGIEGMGPTATLALSEVEVSAKADLAAAVEIFAAAGHQVQAVERCGDAGAEILALAAELEPELIVLGTHGRGALERLFVGSVSTHVVHHWAGPTLVIRGDE